MNQAKIVLTRVDNRLVHGQVGVTWTSFLDIDTIVVVDNLAIHNSIGCKLMKSVALTANKAISFYSVDDFVKVFFESESHQKLFLVVSSPCTVQRLVEKNIPISVVNIGNMHYQRGKVPFNRKMYVDQKEASSINYLIDQNIDVYYQDIPGTLIEKIPHLNYEKLGQRKSESNG